MVIDGNRDEGGNGDEYEDENGDEDGIGARTVAVEWIETDRRPEGRESPET